MNLNSTSLEQRKMMYNNCYISIRSIYRAAKKNKYIYSVNFSKFSFLIKKYKRKFLCNTTLHLFSHIYSNSYYIMITIKYSSWCIIAMRKSYKNHCCSHGPCLDK